MEEGYDVIEFSIDDSVEVEYDMDNILDFINTFAPELKKEVMTVLENQDNMEIDKALFMITEARDGSEEVYYLVLCKVVTLEEKGLMLVYSKNVDLISLYMSNLTTMSYAKVKESFKNK